MEAYRTMVFSSDQNYKVGDTISNMQHWSLEGGEYSDPDLDDTYLYFFRCENIDGEIVDYDRIDEDDEYAERMESLGINAYCSAEKELYVDSSVEFVITEVKSMEDWSEEYGRPRFEQEITVVMK